MTQFIEIIGYLGRDAEERETSTGKKVISFSIAVNTRNRGQDETTWWRCTIWGNEYDNMLPFLKQGTPLVVRGDMRKPELYQSKDGTTQVSLELNVRSINFLPKSRQQNEQQNSQEYASTTASTKTNTNFGFQSNINNADVTPVSEDDLPF